MHRVSIVKAWVRLIQGAGAGETRAAGQGLGHTVAVAHWILGGVELLNR